MNPVARALALLLATTLTPSPLAAQSSPPAGWSERGVFVYGAMLVDFKANVERGASLGDWSLVDCSDEAFYCARGRVFTVALPRDCQRWRVGDVWTHNSVTTSVLAAEDRYDLESLYMHAAPKVLRPDRIYLLGHSAEPHRVFVYSQLAGITEVFYDLRGAGGVDLAKIAKEDGLAGLRRIDSTRRVQAARLTLDAAGNCLTDEKVAAILRGELKFD